MRNGRWRMINGELHGASSLFAWRSSQNGRENQVQLFRLLPELARLRLQGRNGPHGHPNMEFSLAGLFLANTDVLSEFIPRIGIIRFAIVSADACSSSHKLVDH